MGFNVNLPHPILYIQPHSGLVHLTTPTFPPIVSGAIQIWPFQGRSRR